MYVSRTGRRWCSAAVQVQWQHGKRVFTHEGTGVYKEHLMDTPVKGSFTYYEKPDGSTGYADVLPFSVADVDPHVEMTESGFVWLPTQETWTRAGNEKTGFYYYSTTDNASVYMKVSRDPREEDRDRIRTQAAEAAALRQGEADAAEQQRKDEAAAAVKAAAAAESAAKAEAEAEAARLQAEADVAAAQREEQERLAAEAAAAAAEAEAEAAAATAAQEETAAPTPTSAEDASPAPSTGEVEVEAEVEVEEDLVAIARALELMHPEDAAERALAAPPAQSLRELPQDLSVAHDTLQALLHPFETDANVGLKMTVETTSEEEYCYHLEGMRAQLYLLSAQEVHKQTKDVEEEAVRQHLVDKRDTLADRGFKAQMLSLRNVEASSTDVRRRLLALHFNPLSGAAVLFLPQEARRNLLRYVMNVVSLSKALGDSSEMTRVLSSEASLAAVVLEAHREYRSLIAEQKHSLYSADRVKKHQGSRVLAHYAAETHNGYLFWNGLCQTGTDSEGDFHADTNALISRAIEEQWGSYASFCEDFKVHAQSTLGSGYVWLCYESSMEVREQAMVKKFDASEEDKTPEEAVLSITSGEEAVEKPSGETDATEGTDTAAEGTEGTEGEAKDRDITEQVDLRPEDPATPQTPTEEILSRLKFRDSTGKLQGYRLKIVTTLKSESPLTSGFKPLFGVDISAKNAVDEAFLTDTESQDAKAWGIVPGCLDNFIDRYLTCVDWRRAEYQLRTCFPDVLIMPAGLEEAEACLQQSPGEVLNSLWMEKVLEPPSKPVTNKDLVRPLVELKRACYTGGEAFTFDAETFISNVKAKEAAPRWQQSAPQRQAVSRRPPPNAPSRGPGSQQTYRGRSDRSSSNTSTESVRGVSGGDRGPPPRKQPPPPPRRSPRSEDTSRQRVNAA